MSEPTVLYEQIAKALYGDDVDVREVYKGMDGSEVHVPGKRDKSSRERKTALVGMGASGFALGAGLHSLKATKSEAEELDRHLKDPNFVPKRFSLVRGAQKLKIKPQYIPAAVGAGWLGVHGTEMTGDVLAIRAQRKLLAQNKKSGSVEKAFHAFRLRPLGGLRPRIVSPRAVPRPKAPKLVPFQKGLNPLGGAIRAGRMSRNMEQGLANSRSDILIGARRTQADEAIEAGWQKVNSRRRKRLKQDIGTALGGAALVGGAGVGTGLYLKHRKPKVVVPVAPPAPAAPAAPVKKSMVWSGEISKVDQEKHQVFGWANLSSIDGEPIVDLQGDWVPVDEMEDAAYRYVLTSRKGGDMHRRVSKYAGDEPLKTADMIESFVVTPEKLDVLGLPHDALPLGWWLGFKVHDEEQWRMIRSGERTGFSIHGSGRRTDGGGW